MTSPHSNYTLLDQPAKENLAFQHNNNYMGSIIHSNNIIQALTNLGIAPPPQRYKDFIPTDHLNDNSYLILLCTPRYSADTIK